MLLLLLVVVVRRRDYFGGAIEAARRPVGVALIFIHYDLLGQNV